MSLRLRIQDDMKSALKAGEKERLGVVRLMLAAVKQREVDERIELSDNQVLETLDKMVKQRRESIAHFEAGNRLDLAEREAFEISVIQSYLPEPLTEAEIDALIAAALVESGATSIKDMGKVMALVKPRAQGRADIGAVSARIKAHLQG